MPPKQTVLTTRRRKKPEDIETFRQAYLKGLEEERKLFALPEGETEEEEEGKGIVERYPSRSKMMSTGRQELTVPGISTISELKPSVYVPSMPTSPIPRLTKIVPGTRMQLNKGQVAKLPTIYEPQVSPRSSKPTLPKVVTPKQWMKLYAETLGNVPPGITVRSYSPRASRSSFYKFLEQKERGEI